MTEEYDRRNALKQMARAVLGIPMLVVGCGGDNETDTEASEGTVDKKAQTPNHSVPHPNDESLSDTEATGEALAGVQRSPGYQQPKDRVGVELQHTPKGDEYCGNCSQYVPDRDGDGYGACINVAGKIHPCDWCRLYTRQSGEQVISCAQA